MTAAPEKPFPRVPYADPARNDVEIAGHALNLLDRIGVLCANAPMRQADAISLGQVAEELKATIGVLIQRGNHFALFLGVADGQRKATAA